LAGCLAANGFDPRMHQRGRRSESVLTRCPFVAAVPANTEAVCRLRLSRAEVGSTPPAACVERLAAKEPRRAGCRLMFAETI
jgi:hypothetical protein